MQREFFSYGQSGSWYENVNPNESCYTPGYGFKPCPPHIVEKRMIKRCATVLAFCVVFMLFLSFFVGTVLMGGVRFFSTLINIKGYNEIAIEVVSLITFVISIGVPFAFFGAYTKIPVSVALCKRKVSPLVTFASVGCALGASVVGIYASIMVSYVFSIFGISFSNSLSEIPSNYGALIIYIVNMTVIPAIFEEIAFRGFLMQSLRRFGDGFALFVSAFCFSLIHVTPDRFPHTFIMGLVIGYFVLFTGSLSTGMIIHFCYNTIITIMSVAFTYVSINYELLNLSLELIMLFLGIVGLVYFFKNYGKMFVLRKSTTVNSESEKIKTFVLSRGMLILYVVVAVIAAKSVVVS